MSGVLDGKIAVVTGAARGLGRAVARAYASEGAVVYALDMLADEVATLAEEPGDIRPQRLDLTDAAEVAKVFAAIEAEAGRIDVLVNNAGIIFYNPVEAVSVADWDRLMAVNLRGPFLCTRAVAPGMKARRAGAIINVSSNAGVVGGLDESTYCASKFGLEGLSRSLSHEFTPFNVSVNTITPGHPMHTAMSEITYPPELRKIWKDPMELTPAFIHLALQDASGITDKRIRAWDMVQELAGTSKAP
ncbi:3alpha(or 20beta)-hydroxysteroid dehydrogenase [Devosia enhydra]|uniref:3alpha(Or 20beta)-hydroxysteroid dehydrogenase n=1 Tax=Devosia enhydra TaxID=665118 RepID=A0A1K2HVA7_9HYPH|nr:SDR family oxidoreductase [Devosia enhydra]SFZ82578.1 3alpha(or 20beta)-hydroxysteroid dehydrogenase [Devosia enhydra]